jgi:hypothetical protein
VSPARPRDAARRLPLGSHLAALVACAVVPILLFATVLVVRLSAEERKQVERGMLDLCRALATALDRELLLAVGVLELLAESSNLAAGDLRAFHADASRVVAMRPGWQSVVLLRADGQQLMNTTYPWGTPLARVNDPASLADVVKTAKPVVGNVVRGQVSGELAFPVRADRPERRGDADPHRRHPPRLAAGAAPERVSPPRGVDARLQ